MRHAYIWDSAMKGCLSKLLVVVISLCGSKCNYIPYHPWDFFTMTYITVLWRYLNVFITILSVASPKMTPEVIPVRLVSMTTDESLAHTSLKYRRVLYARKNFGGKPGACSSGRREDGSSDGGASGGGASGGRSSGGGSSGEGASGSGVSGDGTGGTGAGGCGGKGCGSYGGGATGCQYRIGETQTFKTISLFIGIETKFPLTGID